jgi:hypothetical protein
MFLTQNYTTSSAASLEERGLGFQFATDLGRPPVSLDAKMRSSFEFSQALLALHELVTSDLRRQQRDHSAYQAWVNKRYLEELDERRVDFLAKLPQLRSRKENLTTRLRALQAERQKLERSLSDVLGEAKRKYFAYLHRTSLDQWLILDPVISVHPDATFFEAFSLDESSYGRVTVPSENLDYAAKPRYGTTNIDFSESLCRELARVRTYRPARLSVGDQEVVVGTAAGQAVEKKIDLPDSWVRGFLQVQAASGMPGTTVYFSSETISSLLVHLRRRRERHGPRSLRFRLKRWEKPSIEIEPWGIMIQEGAHTYDGSFSGEIRVWGRRRLFVLERLLPLAETVEVRLLGTGLPSFWSLSLAGHRFDMGLSGWTANDWSRSAQFDLLAATAPVADSMMTAAAARLEQYLRLDARQLAEHLAIPRTDAHATLQLLCSRGEAMFDLACHAYRWRRLLPPELQFGGNEGQAVTRRAQDLVLRGQVRPDTSPITDRQGVVKHSLVVVGDNKFRVLLERDVDGRVVYAECTCGFYRHNRLRKGPCTHILAAAMYVGAQDKRHDRVDGIHETFE